MGAFAIYRLPYQTQCTLVVQGDGDPEVLLSIGELSGRSGYVVAPFALSEESPLLLMRADETAQLPLFLGDEDQTSLLTPERLAEVCPAFANTPFSLCGESEGRGMNPPLNGGFEGMGVQKLPPRGGLEGGSQSRLRYHIDFANFHSHLQTGEFQKIVLARCCHEPLPVGVSALQLFQKACERYPRMFVTLFSSRQSGTWLMATPEILLDGSGQQWRTIALAGTMEVQQGEPNWSTKNIHEQRYVATYITECLEQFLLGDASPLTSPLSPHTPMTHDIREEGPYTMQAANVLHLRSDFSFTLPEDAAIGRLLRRLHPTPAVCGLPKQQTFDFILRNESVPRRYYSGFTGPLALSGETHLYVSLRCMQIAADGCYLYAGGGLLRDSDEEQEWQETESKLQAMKALLV